MKRMKKLAAIIVSLAMVMTMMPSVAFADETTNAAPKDQYVMLDGDWHFKLYRMYNNMYQYGAYGMLSTVWEDIDVAQVPDADTFSQWEVFQMPADDEVTGGLLPQTRPQPETETESIIESAEESIIESEEESIVESEEESIVESEEESIVESEEESIVESEEESIIESEEESIVESEEESEDAAEKEADEPEAEPDEEPVGADEEPVELMAAREHDPQVDLFPTWSEAWVCRTFEVPAGFTEDEYVTLMLGTIDDIDVVYINGQVVASSGFCDGNKNKVLNTLELGGFDYTNEDPTQVVQFETSYWEVGREYKIPASVLREGTNEIQIRVYNNNSLGGFYSGKIYALCGNPYAVNNLKGLPADAAESESFEAVVEAQKSAIMANDMTAYEATIAESFSQDGMTKAEYVAQMQALLEGKDAISVEDTDCFFLQGDGVLMYKAHREIAANGEILFKDDITQYYLEEGEACFERGNWSHCYTTGYTSELFNGDTLTYSVYLPPSYYTETEKTYPVVYLLHGQNSSSTSYINVDGIEGFMDNLIKEGKVIDMIVVMPDSGKNAFYQDTELDDDPTHANAGPWASQLTDELRLVVEANYRTMNDAKYRGLTGNSMGGGGAYYLGCLHPELFSSVASHMGYLPEKNIVPLKSLTDEQLAQYDFYVDCGLQDATVGTQGTENVHDYLDSKGKEHFFELRDGIHGSAFYMGSMDKSMMWHSEHFKRNMEADQSMIEKLVAHTYVKPQGERLESITMTVKDEACLEGLTKEDFSMSGTHTGWLGFGGGEFSATISEIAVEGNELTLTIPDLDQTYAYVTAFTVTCTKNDGLSFTMEDIDDTITPGADDFEEGLTAHEITYNFFTPEAEGPQPLVVALHGYGDLANLSINQLAVAWAFDENQAERPCYVLAPVIPTGTHSNDAKRQTFVENLHDLICDLVAEGKVDPDRIYITGKSYGGLTAYDYIETYPDEVAGAITMSAYLNPAAAREKVMTNLEKIKNLPLWICQAYNDGTASQAYNQALYDALAEMGSKAVKAGFFTDEEMDAAGAPDYHASECVVLTDSQYAEWLFAQNRVHVHEFGEPVIKPATMKRDGETMQICDCGEVNATPIPRIKSVKLTKTSYVYNKKIQKPAVVVKDRTGAVIDKAFYDVTYAKSPKNVGKYNVTITFKGNYDGTFTRTYKIVPVKPTIKSVKKNGSTAIAVKWNRNKTVTGYQVQYSTSKTFAANKKTVTIKKNGTTEKTIRKLKMGKTYYVRVRSYKVVNGKKLYSAWSGKKYIKIK